MKRRWAEAIATALVAVAAAGCVTFDPAGQAVPDITGTYPATITMTLTNEFETRTDTLTGTLALQYTGYRGLFTGTYAIPANDSGSVSGTESFDGTLIVSTFGPPPKPIAAVRSIRELYPWCDWALLGMPAVRGTLAGDTLRASVGASVPCRYQVNGTTETIHTDVAFSLRGVR
ncbi:MAG: hypothetical protein ABSG61_12095 [Gemmatimonadales bacterium]|jgi:hypothetical protein